MTTCRVTVYTTTPAGRHRPIACGQPVVAGRLCAKHEGDRVRLGGDRDAA